ncbi:50S ribosomal protein L4 [Candidatus Dojkabacteria bacterium]|nr:50S ribosomal protein L4 [Candidatus Dojkabacteria bacterium]
MKVNYFDEKLTKIEKGFDLNDKLADVKENLALVSQYIYVYQSNQRQATAKTKDRSEVSGGGRKPWKQKGTGRARIGSNRVPNWRGGGVSFGPDGTQNYKKTMNKKMKAGAVKCLLNDKIKNGKLIVLKDLSFDKTKEAEKLLGKLPENRNVLIVHNKDDNFYKIVRNISWADAVRVDEFNGFDIYSSDLIVLLEGSIDNLIKRLNK